MSVGGNPKPYLCKWHGHILTSRSLAIAIVAVSIPFSTISPVVLMVRFSRSLAIAIVAIAPAKAIAAIAIAMVGFGRSKSLHLESQCEEQDQLKSSDLKIRSSSVAHRK